MNLVLESKNYKLTLPESYIPQYQVIKEYFDILRSLDEGKQSHILIPQGWNLKSK